MYRTVHTFIQNGIYITCSVVLTESAHTVLYYSTNTTTTTATTPSIPPTLHTLFTTKRPRTRRHRSPHQHTHEIRGHQCVGVYDANLSAFVGNTESYKQNLFLLQLRSAHVVNFLLLTMCRRRRRRRVVNQRINNNKKAYPITVFCLRSPTYIVFSSVILQWLPHSRGTR